MECRIYKTSDLPLAAYLTMKGLSLIKATKNKNGKFEFCFEDPEGRGEFFSYEYIKSDFNVFDNHVRTVKKFLYSKQE